MSLSTQLPKFLLDANVNVGLLRFLTDKGFDVKVVPKTAPDLQVASMSKIERRVLATNDADFCNLGTEDIYGVIWLRLPQGDYKALIKSFEKMVGSMGSFLGKLIVLKKDDWDEFRLGEDLE